MLTVAGRMAGVGGGREELLEGSLVLRDVSLPANLQSASETIHNG
jgi:hypothetical protein